MSTSIVPTYVKSKIEEIVSARSADSGLEDSFFVIDPEVLLSNVQRWKEFLPFVTPHYAIKCNDHKEVVSRLAQWGFSFDCASQKEIQTVVEGYNVPPSRIIYANPIKAPSHLKYAAQLGVKRMTADNSEELYKINRIAPNSEVLLRIKTDDSGAVCSLSCKFGADMTVVEDLLKLSRDLSLNVVGVAYHVGSGGGLGPEAHADALKDSRAVFEMGLKFGFDFNVLDIGGGFDADLEEFKVVSAQIKRSLEELKFPEQVEFIAEPGRFVVANVFTLVANVIGVRRAPNKDETDMVYLTDGVYGNLNSIIYDHQVAVPYLVGDWDVKTKKQERASLWGPTCDGLDSITDSTGFPRRLNIGDWIYFINCGAYTLVGQSQFNGFNINTQVFVAKK